MPAALAVALALLSAAPAAAQIVIDFSWTSETQYKPRDGSGVLVGGALQGRDRSAGSTLITLRETPTGITLSGSHGSVFDRVSFSGTGPFRSVAALESATGLVFVALALGAAAGVRARSRR